MRIKEIEYSHVLVFTYLFCKTRQGTINLLQNVYTQEEDKLYFKYFHTLECELDF